MLWKWVFPGKHNLVLKTDFYTHTLIGVLGLESRLPLPGSAADRGGAKTPFQRLPVPEMYKYFNNIPVIKR